MKTKTKTLALVEVAVVLCSMLLVATLPAITTASEDDFTLGIYGNANEDDTIDMRDTTYIKLVIFGKKTETDFADANNDGKVSMLDVGQTKLIILGKEKELTLIDTADRTVTVNMPIERIVTAQWSGGEIASILNVKDRVVGVPEVYVSGKESTALALYPELCELPSVGNRFDPDFETILSLSPDIVLMQEAPSPSGEDALEKVDIPVVVIHLWKPAVLRDEILKCGYILEKRDEANEYIDFCREYENMIKERTEELSEAEKPRVYIETIDWKGIAYQIYAQGSWADNMCTIAGGRNIAAGTDFFGNYVEVEPEWVVAQNPDIIFKSDWDNSGYTVDDTSAIKAVSDEIMSRPELANINAVKEGKCYVYGPLPATAQTIIGVTYFAKWIQPDLFEDLDPKAVHQEFLDKFFGDANFDLDEHGVFVYHPEEHPEGG